jgi:hypothetical protein
MTLTKVNPRRMTLTNAWGVTKTIAEWAEAQEINEIYEILGGWAVTDYGLEYLTQYYPIPKDRLWEGDGYYSWEWHMAQKRWVDPVDFEAALAAARKCHSRTRGNPRQ